MHQNWDWCHVSFFWYVVIKTLFNVPTGKIMNRAGWENTKSPYLSQEQRRILNNLKFETKIKNWNKTYHIKLHLGWGEFQVSYSNTGLVLGKLKRDFAMELVRKNSHRIHHWRHFPKSQFLRRLNNSILMSGALSFYLRRIFEVNETLMKQNSFFWKGASNMF